MNVIFFSQYLSIPIMVIGIYLKKWQYTCGSLFMYSGFKLEAIAYSLDKTYFNRVLLDYWLKTRFFIIKNYLRLHNQYLFFFFKMLYFKASSNNFTVIKRTPYFHYVNFIQNAYLNWIQEMPFAMFIISSSKLLYNIL